MPRRRARIAKCNNGEVNSIAVEYIGLVLLAYLVTCLLPDSDPPLLNSHQRNDVCVFSN